MARNYNGQAAQDYFVLKCLNLKKNGVFVEIGSNNPIKINNTYKLETEYDWTGLMIEYDPSFLPSYVTHRPKSQHIIQNATTIQFDEEFKKRNLPKNIDYLQIDLEVDNQSTIRTLENLNSQVMSEYKFAVVTFEHDSYRGNHFNTKSRSREIFDSHGYIRVFSGVSLDGNEFEDWYVHPTLVDMNYINKIKSDKEKNHIGDILNILDSN